MRTTTVNGVAAAAVCFLLLADVADVPAVGTVQPTALDSRMVEIADRVAKNPKSPEALLDVIAMGRMWDVTTPGLFEKQAERLAGIKTLHPEAKLRLLDFERERLAHEGLFEDAAKAVEEAGFVTSWLAIGPFDNENRKGWETEFEPEMDLERSFDTGIAYQGDERPVMWREIDTIPLNGRLDLRNHLYPTTKVCGYAGTYVEAKSARTIQVRAASGGTLRIWVDQTLAIQDDVYRNTGLDRHTASVKLGKGTHRLLAKVCVDSGPWNLIVRITDGKGEPIEKMATLEPEKPYDAAKQPPKVKEVPTAFSQFESALEKDEDDPEALADLARYMVLTHSDDLTQTLAGDHAQKAAEATGCCKNLILLAMATDDPDIGINALRTCTIKEPDNEHAAFLYAAAMKRTTGGADFNNHLHDLARRFPDDLRIQLLWLQEHVDMGLPSTAYSELTELKKRFGEVPDLLRASEYLASSAMSVEEAVQWKMRLLAVRADETGVTRDLVDRAVALGDENEAIRLLETLIVMWPDDRRVLSYASSKHMQMGNPQEAGKLLEKAAEVSPHNPGEWEQLGNFYRLMGENDLALAAFTTVLELNPANVQVREYLAHLFPHSKFEQEFIVGKEELLDMDEALEAEEDPPPARDIGRYDAMFLVDQQVDRVYGNGMSARFYQQVIRINSEQGEKIFRYIPITYAPLREDLDLIRARVYREDGTVEEAIGRYSFPTFDPAVRIYYDMVKEVIEFPSLREGDIIDVQYKISDATARNMFERHFGTLIPVQSPVPKGNFRYGLITPQDLEIHVGVTQGSGLVETMDQREATEHDPDPTTLRLWQIKDVDAIEDEPRMPSMVEISPLIKVSTFETWEQFGHWWWGLISPQMVADKTIKDKVAELTEGLETETEKVAAIFDWVIRSTRYIALEFGVHGFKPYTSPQVVARGFGDCKDKATLLYVMFREAGIDAALALVRTRSAGEIGSDFPFQFQFNHVIAYVPSLDIFLDGTVDYLGIDNLPPSDQDVFSLVVQDGKVTPRRTPRMPHTASETNSRVTFELDEEGNADLSGHITIKGTTKAWYRSNFQTEGTQEERLEQQLSTIFPGLALETWKFAGLDDYGDDVQIDFTARIPNFALAHEGTMQLSILPSHDLFSSFASLSKREHDVLIGYPRLFIDTHTYIAPAGWEIVDGPDDLVLGHEADPYWFSLDATTKTANTAIYSATLGFNEYRVMVDDYGPFRSFCSKVDDVMGQRAHLSEVKP